MLFLGLNSKAALIAYFIPAYTIFQAHACNFSCSPLGVSDIVIINYESFVVPSIKLICYAGNPGGKCVSGLATQPVSKLETDGRHAG
ncbi:hypothetical protein BDK62_1243 [Halomonas alkaliantarctica]|nr:hypothetical protein BDK62_1243 [Halomonas alkaliantarctica]